MGVIRVIAITILWLVAVGPLEAATLTWDANPEPDLIGYRVSYGTASGVHTTSVDVGKVLTYNLTPPSGQRYYIVVQAYNDAGVSPKSNEVVLDLTTTTISNQPPTLNQPANQSGFVGSSATLVLSGSDPENATLRYSATGLPAGLSLNSSSGAISGTLQTAGNYSVTATVSDGSLSASRTFSWTVSTQPTSTTPPASTDTTAPTVSITSPSNNETLNAQNVKVRATASDAGGVRSVRYSVNGNALSGEISTAPYTYTWDLSSVASGTYQLTARAVDMAGNAGTATISVIVKNGGNGKNSLSNETLAGTDAPESGDGDADAAAPVRSAADIPVSGDFDGDGLADPGAFTALTGEWRLWLSSSGYAASAPLTWGVQEDVPVPADYDGDGRADLAVFRPSTGTWSIVLSNGGSPSRLEVSWGRPGDSPMPFDYDHDGRADLALRRSGGFDILLSSKNFTTSVAVR
jgi:hypothetical protein